MIISHKHKYIFIGLPFSGSSAISKELIEHYDGELLMAKHTNINHLLKSKNINIQDYFVFAVYRDPIDILNTAYSKFVNNSKGVFTNKKFFLENGGHVSIRKRRLFKKIQEEHLTFYQFISTSLKNIPYDNVFSLNEPYLNYVINFENLSENFKYALSHIEIKPKRDLPVYNKTSKKLEHSYNSMDKIPILIVPYLKRNMPLFSYSHNDSINEFMLRILFHILHPLRKYLWLKKDLNRTGINDDYFGTKKSNMDLSHQN